MSAYVLFVCADAWPTFASLLALPRAYGQRGANVLVSAHAAFYFFRGYRQAIEMCYYLLRNEGIWVGPSAALNVVGTGLIQSGTGLPVWVLELRVL